MMESTNDQERRRLDAILDALADLDADARQRVLRMVAIFYDIPVAQPSAILPRPNVSAPTTTPPLRAPSFAERETQSPKDFLLEKEPHSDTERVACLAYYLTHHQDTPHFKTLDISKLNTEAAQRKFSNAAVAVNNAASRGFLVGAGRGLKQLSAAGERFVDALPDREAARHALDRAQPRKARKTAKPPRSRKAKQ